MSEGEAGQGDDFRMSLVPSLPDQPNERGRHLLGISRGTWGWLARRGQNVTCTTQHTVHRTALGMLYSTGLSNHCLYTQTSPFWVGGGVGVYFLNQQIAMKKVFFNPNPHWVWILHIPLWLWARYIPLSHDFSARPLLSLANKHNVEAIMSCPPVRRGPGRCLTSQDSWKQTNASFFT